MATGDIEIVPERIAVLGRCRYNELPFQINHSREADEAVRLKYRYLDLRNPEVKRNIILRCSVVAAIRKAMLAHDFLEITTPILTASSPEGARDYLVPARNHPGKFYALPQAPQQFKQLLMASGFDRYFQIAPCFRDEDARADRSPGEFYQLDMFQILVAEDDANQRRLMSAVLRGAGYEVHTAADGAEALRMLDEVHDDLLRLGLLADQGALLRQLFLADADALLKEELLVALVFRIAVRLRDRGDQEALERHESESLLFLPAKKSRREMNLPGSSRAGCLCRRFFSSRGVHIIKRYSNNSKSAGGCQCGGA